MSVLELRTDYENGILAKHDYIAKAHAHHIALFEYAHLLTDTDIEAIEIIDGRVIMRSRSSHVRLVCDPQDTRTAPIETLNFGSYEKEDEQAFYRLLKPSDTLLDIGANIGWYSLNVAKRFPDTRVHSFEPLPSTFRLLRENASLNPDCAVHLHNFGFSDANTELTFYFNPASTGSSSSVNLTGTPDAVPVICKVRRLDDYLREEPALKPDVIKCDVEGAELLVFKGAVESLEAYKPVVFTEMLRKWSALFGYHPNDIIQLLGSLGYRCYAVKGRALEHVQAISEMTIETNFLFLHPQAHQDRLQLFAQLA